MLGWQKHGRAIRVVKLARTQHQNDTLKWLRRLGRVPFAPRDKEPVRYSE